MLLRRRRLYVCLEQTPHNSLKRRSSKLRCMKGRLSGRFDDNGEELKLKASEMGLSGKAYEDYIKRNYVSKGIIFDEEYVDRHLRDDRTQNQPLPDQK